MKSRMSLTVLVLIVTTAFFNISDARAQGELPPGSVPEQEYAVSQEELDIVPQTYGTTATTYAVVGPWEFHPGSSTATYNFTESPVVGIYRTNPTGTTIFVAPFSLPSGALMTGLRFHACDTTPTGQIFFSLERMFTEGGFTNIFLGTTGSAAVEGCKEYLFNLATPITVNNATESFALVGSLSETGTGLVLGTTRIAYRLQVSPAPATATFPNDVPTTHPFFRFIEALAASGVTSGCAPGSYCPNSPITRGEMAVFLSAALGLHFAP